MKGLYLICILLGFDLIGSAQQSVASQNETCTGCHEQGKKVALSVHASVACATCHVKHDDYPHPAGIPKPDCATCHSSEGRDYARGVHGQEKSHGNS